MTREQAIEVALRRVLTSKSRDLDAAIKALRAALSLPADPVPEPVAWQERQQSSPITWTDWYPCPMPPKIWSDGQVMNGIRYEWRPLYAAPVPAPHQKPEAALPRPGSPEASAMIDSVLAEYGWPANPKNAARAGFEAACRLSARPTPQEQT